MRLLFQHLNKKQTLHSKLFFTMLILAFILVISLFSFMSLFGTVSQSNKEITSILNLQINFFERDVSHHFNNIAIRGAFLSKNSSTIITQYLDSQDITLDDVEGNAEHISNLQTPLMMLLKNELLKSNCSGAYLILDTSLNFAENSKAGIYIQKDMYSSNGEDSLLLYRGTPSVGKEHEIMPHRKWRLEFNIDNFPSYYDVLNSDIVQLERACYLNNITELPGTSERAMVVSIPIRDDEGNSLGICGFEVTQNFFKSIHPQPTSFDHIIGIFAANRPGCVDINEGLSCGKENGYYLSPTKALYFDDYKNGLSRYKNELGEYVGITKQMDLIYDNADFSVSIMIPMEDYQVIQQRGIVQYILIIFLSIIAIFSCCMYFSKQYINPIAKGIEKIRQSEHKGQRHNILEIDDLFEFLSQRDDEFEKSLSELQNKNKELNELSKNQDAQVDIQELAKMSQERNYKSFKVGIKTLTKTEKLIYELYLQGKNATDIQKELDIKQSTLKFHNRNLYDKLGVSSKKQLLYYASLYEKES